MITFIRDGNVLLLEYSPEGGTRWMSGALKLWHRISVKGGVFSFKREDFHENAPTDEELESGEFDTVEFVLGDLRDDYYVIRPHIVGTDHVFHIHRDMPLSQKLFVAERNVSVLRAVDALVTGDVYFGGAHPDALPEAVVDDLISRFPNQYELKKYTHARVAACIRDHLDLVEDSEAKYQRYLSKRRGSAPRLLPRGVWESELAKYEYLTDRLEGMLADEVSYDEHRWQQEITEIILLLYPKYVRRFTAVPVRDVYAKKWRQLDFMLVDADGHIDVVEIKKPFDRAIMSKDIYRDNHIPIRELSGTIMQVEKYLFYLNKWGREGEEYLTQRYAGQIPSGIQVQIVNPQGLVIMGRDNGLTPEQRRDFEVVKRKYKNLVDIITYDDLLRRLRILVSSLSKSGGEASPSGS